MKSKRMAIPGEKISVAAGPCRKTFGPVLGGSVLLSCLVAFCGPNCSTASANEGKDESLDYLKGLSFEDLLQTEVTSVSKRSEKLVDAAAAVFVISAEDIERMGVRSIPDALRMVPGMHVAHINANKFAVSARGFSDLFSNKMLVLIDGRSVYSPLFSGVFWDLQDTVLEDIERIEVIRGPGATLWGANAVNGVINIITKSADQTQGTLVSIGSGSVEPIIASARYGGAIDDIGNYRVYIKGTRNDGFKQPDGLDGFDAWKNLRGGFRSDVELRRNNRITFQGEVVEGEEEIIYNFPGLRSGLEARDTVEYRQANLLARWENGGKEGGMSLQAYYDYTKIVAEVPKDDRHSFDVEFQHKSRPFTRHELVWGLGYRVTGDDIEGNDLTAYSPESRTTHLYSAFVQDEVMLLEDSWWLTIGTKLEHNDYSGFELQPNLRTSWKPANNQTLWAAVSRAVRAPSRADHDIRSNIFGWADASGNRYKAVLFGSSDFESEELIAYEIGHRYAPGAGLSFDTAIFYNVYENLRSIDLGTAFVDMDAVSPYLAVPLHIGNGLSGTTYGLEFFAAWQPLTTWRLSFGYALLQTSLDGEEGTIWAIQQFEEDDFVEHQFQVRSSLDLTPEWSFDTELYFVDELSGQDIDSYFRLDMRLAWQVNSYTTLSISGENLLRTSQPEFSDINSVVATEVPRRFFINMTWRY